MILHYLRNNSLYFTISKHFADKTGEVPPLMNTSVWNEAKTRMATYKDVINRYGQGVRIIQQTNNLSIVGLMEVKVHINDIVL